MVEVVEHLVKANRRRSGSQKGPLVCIFLGEIVHEKQGWSLKKRNTLCGLNVIFLYILKDMLYF